MSRTAESDPSSLSGGCPAALLSTGPELAGAATLASFLSRNITTADVAPDLVSFSTASPTHIRRLRDAATELTDAVLEFLGDVQPNLVSGARQQQALVAQRAQQEHVDAQRAAQELADRHRG